MQTFSIRDLRDRSGELTREAEEGRLSLVTKHGQPLFVTLPFTDEVMEHGARFGLALQLYKNHDVSLGKAAQIAQMPYADFLFRVGRLGIPVVDYSVEDFKQELATLEQLGYL
jgi:predicted HTH domain antitoxin